MDLSDTMRYGLLLGVAATANANRRHYRMATTWLPHLAMNTAALLLPDALRPILTAAKNDSKPTTLFADTLRALVCDNTAYIGYVLPLAVGYLLSHPRFNIYKGDWGEMQICGFGFDAIPHAAAGFTLSAAVTDTIYEAARNVSRTSPLAKRLEWANDHAALLALVALALVTLGWESSEYLVHRHELALRGDISKINMQWSLGDTMTDCLANLLGWGAAVALRR